MSYQALYRKWRPDNFEDVKGQDHIVTTLKNQINADRIGHAYLFCGTRGTGKTSVAKIFAKAVNCEHPVNGSPCGECPTCKAIAAGTSMNVIEIDAASNNGVDNIREIRDEVQYSPTEGKYKVYIIDEVHMLSTGAFNALLKTLEEPPSYVIFILATTEVAKIPVTIMSRCQRYDFHRISIETIADRLSELMKAENIVVEDKAIRYVAKAADGSMRDALSLLDQCIAFHTAPMIRKWQGEMIDKGFKPTYLKTINNQLSSILNYAVRFYELRSNPCHKAGSMGKSKADERPYWTLEEFQKFSDAIMDKRDSWMAFQILFWTGMRIGELLALQVKDVNFEDGTIRVDESLTRLDGEDLITAPKTESSVRVITIHKELKDEIREYISTLYRPKPGTRLFAGRTKSFFEHEMERGIKLSGVKKITVHCTRHSHASMLVQMGFSPIEIAKRLGHGKVTTTIETYCHQSRDAQEKIADRLGKVDRGEEDGV